MLPWRRRNLPICCLTRRNRWTPTDRKRRTGAYREGSDGPPRRMSTRALPRSCAPSSTSAKGETISDRRDHRGLRRARLRLRADPVQPAELRAGAARHRRHRRHAGPDLRHPDDARPQAALAAGLHPAPHRLGREVQAADRHRRAEAPEARELLQAAAAPAVRPVRRPGRRPVRLPGRRVGADPVPGHQLPALHRPGHRLHRRDGGGRLSPDRRLSHRARRASPTRPRCSAPPTTSILAAIHNLPSWLGF